jgi:hypothetical protein
MTKNAELEDVKRKVRMLLARTPDRGCTEGEAMHALQKAGALLAQYNLSMTEIDVYDEPCVTGEFRTGGKKSSRYIPLVPELARFCGVRTWLVRGNEVVFKFFGFEPDVQLAEYLCTFLQTSTANAVQAFKHTPEYKFADMHRKSLSTSFINGLNKRLVTRLKDMQRERTDTVLDRGFQSSSNALVTMSKEDKIDVGYKKLGLRLKTVSSWTRTTSEAASQAGAAAGDQINLSRPLTTSRKPTLLIGHDG